jgi:sulfite exporter TauE/SafE/copper chaperone CopZ
LANEIKNFSVDGMVCESCEKVIERYVKKVKGVDKAKADYATQRVEVTYNPKSTDIDEIVEAIREAGYTVVTGGRRLKNATFIAGLFVVVFGGYLIAQNFSFFEIPEIGQTTSLFLLFTVGLFTGFHCVGMCGGFVLSYSSKKGGWKDHVQYGGGKLLSYTAIGAIFGLIGSIFVFTPLIRGLAAVIAGLFLMLYGLNMLNVSPRLRRIRLPIPKSLTRFSAKTKDRGPLTIGLMNGLMLACGPLQALYIYAAGTGSVVQGALALFAFGLGTLPVLMGFGVFTAYISRNATQNILKASGVIMLLLGVVMLNRGLALTGTGYDFNTIAAAASSESITGAGIATFSGGFQEIRMEVNRYGWSPDKFVLKKGIPVKWIINGVEINGCNNEIVIPRMGLSFDVEYGEQIIEFTPTEEGVIPWSCWMGMIPGAFVIKDDINLQEAEADLQAIQLTSTGSCGGSCGVSTCGAATGGTCGCGR